MPSAVACVGESARQMRETLQIANRHRPGALRDSRQIGESEMLFMDYIDAVTTDAVDAVERGDYDTYTDIDDVIDAMWVDDGITGNGSGSYTFNTCKAQENVSDLIWDDQFIDELNGMCIDLADLLRDGAESVDVTARCLALSYARDEIEGAWDERQETISD